MLLICQLLNPAQAPAEVCLNSGNGTNMVLFLPRAKPYSSCIALGCFLRLLLARSRAGLVQCHAARAGLALLAPITLLCPLLFPLIEDSPGHPPAQPLVLVAAAGDSCPALEGFGAVGHGVPSMQGGCSQQAKGAAGWDGGRAELGQSGAPAWFSPVGGARCPHCRGSGHRWFR